MNEINQDTTQAAAFKSIAVFGVGPGLGQAVALWAVRQFAWLEVDSVKMALSRPAHAPRYPEGTYPLQGATQTLTVGRLAHQLSVIFHKYSHHRQTNPVKSLRRLPL